MNGWDLRLCLSLYFIHNFYCEWLTFETMLFVTMFIFYTQLLLWTANIWDYVCHYMLIYYTIYYIYYSPGAINGAINSEKKYQKKESNSCRNLCPPMCIFNAMVNLHFFPFLLRCHLPYWSIQWTAKKRSDLSHTILFLMHMSCQGLSISRPSRFVLHVITNLLWLFVFFLAKLIIMGVCSLSVNLCSSSVCGSFCVHLFDVNEWIVQLVFLECCASNLFLLYECLWASSPGVHSI